MEAANFLGLVSSALLALNLWQLTGLRGDVKSLAKTVGEHDKDIASIKKVFEINGCDKPGTGCAR